MKRIAELQMPCPRESLALRTVAGPLLALAALASPLAHGAGGHHAVDDASMLDRGQCQVETWFDRGQGNTLLHVGPACRVGAVELGVNMDRSRSDGELTRTTGIQVKWAKPFRADLAAGLVLAIAVPDRSPRDPMWTAVLPVTLQLSDALSFHANLGRDRVRGAPGTVHSGAALEWAATPTWSFVAERFREAGQDRARIGTRWSLTPALSVDLSRAHGLQQDATQWWTVGLNWVFES